MSKESQEWLENNILIGFTEKRGEAWWDRGATREDGRPNHYTGPVPVADVKKLLFDWQAVESESIEITVKINGRKVKIAADPADFKAIVRPDTKDVFKIFSGGYRIHQYRDWLVEGVETILDDDLQIGSAGLLRRGKTAWVQVEAPENRTVAGFEHRPFILAATSMDGTIATSYRRGVTAVVCDNTLSAGLSEKSDVIKFKHTSGSIKDIAAIRDALKIIFETGDEFESEVRKLLAQKVNTPRFTKWAEAASDLAAAQAKAKIDGASTRSLTLAETKRDQLINLWQKDDRVAPWKGTAFGVVQAWNTYVHHFSNPRGQTRPEANMIRVARGYVGREDQYALDTLARV